MAGRFRFLVGLAMAAALLATDALTAAAGVAGGVDPPGPPRDPRIGLVTCATVEVSWNPPENGLTVAAYDVYVDERLAASVDGDTVQATVAGLAARTSYRFTVRARDTMGNSSLPSPVVVGTTSPCEGEPPTAPTGLRVESTTQSCAVLRWLPATDDVGVVGYHVFLNDVLMARVEGTTATLCGLVPGVRYSVTVSAFDADGNESVHSEPVVVVISSCVVCAVRTVATSPDVPWGLVTLPDGSILYTERDRLTVVRVAPDGRQSVVGKVPDAVITNGEGGVTGLEIAPTFTVDRWLYIFHTSPRDNRIVRIRYAYGRLDLSTKQVLLSGIARNRFSNGGRLRWGPDGKLYAGTGDAQNRRTAQDPRSLNGKILRLNPDGTVPRDNPTPGSYMWSLGHRNPQGLAFDSHGRLWAAEFGESSVDELNLVVKGGNYGWPVCEGLRGTGCTGPVFTPPVRTFPVAQASPSGVAIVDNVIYMAALRGQRLYRMVITGDTTAPPQQFLVGVYGRLRTVEPAPDGGLWLTTSNTDGHQGVPRSNRILHVALGTTPV